MKQWTKGAILYRLALKIRRLQPDDLSIVVGIGEKGQILAAEEIKDLEEYLKKNLRVPRGFCLTVAYDSYFDRVTVQLRLCEE
ncbi:MAG: hypothetical protein WAT17_04075 [Candidatus Saccharimonadales bacterium]|jgi:hypothetical protein